MNNNEWIPFEPDYATTPGEMIEEYMDAYGVNKEALGREAGLDPETTDSFLAGRHPVTPEIAAALARLFPRPVDFWQNMETLYQRDKQRLATRGGSRAGAGRKPNPPRRYSIALPNALGRELDARAKASGLTSYRWIVNTLKRELTTG